MYHAKEGTLVDEELKDRLMNKEILAYIASQFVDDFAMMGWRQVLPYLEDPLSFGVNRGDRERSDREHGSIRYDILVRLRSPKGKDKRIGVLLNIEGQNEVRSYEAVKRRMLYYTCRLVSEQKEDVFTNDRYEDLAEVVSVWLFLRPAEKDQGRVVEWSMAGRQLSDLDESDTRWKGGLKGLKVVAVCIPDLDHVQWESHAVADLLGVWLNALLPAGERSERLKDGWDVELPPQQEEDTGMFEGAGRSLWKEGLRQGRQEGIQEGVQQGRREGILQGKEANLLENIQSLVEQLHLSPEQAMDALKVPAQDRGRIREKLLPSS